MGWVSRHSSAGLAGAQMNRAFRLLAFLTLGLLLGGTVTLSYAGAVRYEFRGVNVSREGGQTHIRGTSPSELAATVSGGVVTTNGAAAVGSKSAAFVSRASLAADAASIAVAAIRLNPTGLIGGAVASWLLVEGIEYIDGAFKKDPPSDTSAGAGNVYASGRSLGDCTTSAPCTPAKLASILLPHLKAAYNWDYVSGPACVSNASGPCGQIKWTLYNNGAGFNTTDTATRVMTSCAPGYYLDVMTCVKTAAKVAMEEADWSTVKSKPLPDGAAQDLINKGVKTPVSPLAFDPPFRDVPLSDPYRDPVTDKTYRDKARVTPQPSTPETAKLEVTKEEVDPATGEPVIDPGTGQPPAPEKQTDFCIEHPEALACWEAGEPEDSELEKVTAGTAITPVVIGGAGSCPSDKTVNYMGANLVLSFSPICMAAGWINPIVLALAWLSAGYILIGAFKQG